MNADANRARLLVVDDEPDLRALYEITLMRAGHAVDTAADLEQARTALRAGKFDVLVTDMRLPDGQGLELLQELQAQQRPERCIVITAYGSADSAVRALKAGAFDYLTKPVNLDQFRRVVASALQAAPAAAQPAAAPAPETPLPARPADAATPGAGGPPQPLPAANTASAMPAAGVAATQAAWPAVLDQMVGHGQAMQQLKATLVKVAPSMAPVLILGESGSGKELVARGLHACSHRANGPFVAVNCGAIPENLLEAEFFGAKKGAYTGSVADREGFFQAAHGGTLFLDEIGDLPLPMQAKLLRVIQERQVRPLGAAQEVAIDVRVVSATHKNLADMVQHGAFRQDLYYRLNVIDVRVPPLRERREDIPALAQALLRKIVEPSASVPVMVPGFLYALQLLPLAGNVRELENTLHRCVALSDGGVLDDSLLRDVPGAMPAAPGVAMPVPAAAASPLQDAALPGPAATAFGMPGGVLHALQDDAPDDAASAAAAVPGEAHAPHPSAACLPPQPLCAHEIALPCSLAAFVDAHEKALLLRALQQTGFNRTAAAALLGLNLRQIRYRMERLGIEDPRGPVPDEAGAA